MKLKKNIIFLSLLFTIFLVGCSHYNDLQKDIKQSVANEDESHKTGEDCMSCHNHRTKLRVKVGGMLLVRFLIMALQPIMLK
jgi:hypothetical protein